MYRLLTLCMVLLTAPARAGENPDERAPLAPFQIADNFYYVGSRDLATYLVTTPKGNILINANLATSPPLIRASIETLGFRWSDYEDPAEQSGPFRPRGWRSRDSSSNSRRE